MDGEGDLIMKKSILVLAVAAIAASAAVTHAESFDQTVASIPTGSNAGNLYYGAGNAADNFATTSTASAINPSNTITIGLRAAFASAFGGYTDIAGPTGTYFVSPGFQEKTPGPPPTFSTSHPTWDYVYSIDLGGDSTTSYSALLTIENLTTGLSDSYDPLANGAALGNDQNSSGYEAGSGPTFTIQQNAESASFGIGGPVLDTNVNAPDAYLVTLELFDSSDDLFLEDQINIDVVPLPASAWSGLALIGGLGLFGGIKRLRRQMA
jgi:hypothetical protein